MADGIARLVAIGCGVALIISDISFMVEYSVTYGYELFYYVGMLLGGLILIFLGFPLWQDEGPKYEMEKKTKIIRCSMIPLILCIIIGGVIYNSYWDNHPKSTYSWPTERPQTQYRESSQAKAAGKSSSSSSGAAKSSQPKSSKSGVKGYTNFDDFYDDHYDDFWDIDEAEEYYYDHGGW